jgi:hypothetical protein
MKGKFSSTVFQIVKAIFSFLRHGWQVRFSNPSNAVLKVLRLGGHRNLYPLNSSLKLEASHQQLLFFFGRSMSPKKTFCDGGEAEEPMVRGARGRQGIFIL